MMDSNAMRGKLDALRNPSRGRGLALVVTFWLAALCLLAGLAVGLMVYLERGRHLRATFMHELEMLRDQKIAAIEQWAGERRIDLGLAAGNWQLRRFLQAPSAAHAEEWRDEAQAYLGDMASIGGYRRVCLLRIPDGAPLLWAGAAPRGEVVSPAQWAATLVSPGLAQVSDVIVQEGAPVLVFTLAIGVPQQPPMAVLAMEQDLGRELYSRILPCRLGDTGEVLLVNRRGLAMSPHRTLSGTVGVFENRSRPAALAARGERGLLTAPDYSGQMVVAAHGHLPSLGWGIVVKQDLAELELPLRDLARSILLVSLAVALAGSGLGWFVARRISAPVSALAGAVQALGRDERDVRVPATGWREAADLAEAFNRMAAHLEEARATLERRVAERTADLSGANLRLEEEVRRRARTEDDLQEAKERALALARDAQAASRAKSEFLANMSHEIRTPLNALLGFAELLSRRAHDPAEAEMLASIQASGKALLALINDILDLSKVEAGRMPVKPAAMSPAAVLRDVRGIFAPQAAAKGVDYLEEASSDLPASVLLDEVRLRQVLVNLVGNAVKFTDRGQVKVSARAGFVDAAAGTADLFFTVADTGIGIPADQQGRIFEAFAQAADRQERHGGTGLGLTISRRLLALMGGTVSVESAPGRGAVFTVALHGVPVLAREPAPAGAGADAGAGRATAPAAPLACPRQGRCAACGAEAGNVREMVAALEGLDGNWRSVSRRLVFREVEDFAAEVLRLAEAARCASVLDWSRRVTDLCRQVDVDGIRGEMERWPLLLAAVRAATAVEETKA